MATDKIPVGLRITELVRGKLQVIAVRESRSLNNLIEYILRRYIEEYEAEHGEIQIKIDE